MMKFKIKNHHSDFNDIDKAIIEKWQKTFPTLFPHKPEPKKYLRERAWHMAIEYAVSKGYSKAQGEHAKKQWCQGYRWNRAVLCVKRAEERSMLYLNSAAKRALKLLAKDYPMLFAPASKEDIRPLKIGIDKDLMTWANEKDISEKSLRLALGYWVRSKDYVKALAESKVRYDLELNECEKKVG